MTKTELSNIVWPNYVKSVMIRLLSHVYIAFSAISKNGSLVVTVYLCPLYYKYFIFYAIIVLDILLLEKDIRLIIQHLVWKYLQDLCHA